MSGKSDSTKPLILGSRGSDLAVTQVRQTEDCLLRAGHTKVEVCIINTIGDKRPDLKLSQFSDSNASGGEPIHDKGVFTKELEEALLSGEIQAAVHSLKDVPTELNEKLSITATLERAPIEDVLLMRAGEEPHDLSAIPDGGTVATSSVRRARQLNWLRPDLNIVDIRGNVPTRIRKLLDNSDWDAIMLARAGLQRLGFLDSDQAAGTLKFEGAQIFFVKNTSSHTQHSLLTIPPGE